MLAETPEVERQFDALDLRPVVRWLEDPANWTELDGAHLGDPTTVSYADAYLDTDDQRLYRARYALRLRTVGRGRDVEATLKALDSSTGPAGPRRSEFTEPTERPDPAVLISLQGPVGTRVRGIVGARRLSPLFEVRTRRRLYAVDLDGAWAGEIALDETAIQVVGGGEPARLRRIAIGLPEAMVEKLEPLVSRLASACALQPAALSKYEAGRLSAGLTPPPQIELGETEVGSDMSLRAVALAALRSELGVMLRKEPGTRLGDSIEELHEMRVAVRRLRAALSVFAGVLPETVVKVGPELAWLGRALGRVRDLDVQLEQLAVSLAEATETDRNALAPLRSVLDAQRNVARDELLQALDSRRYEVFVSRFQRTLSARHKARSGVAAQPALAVAPDLINDCFVRFRKAADRIGEESAPAEYHRLRIRGKRLRYTLEFLGDLYPARTKRLVKALGALQDLLGLHQDADIAIERLRRLASRHRELEPETVFAMGEIAERHRQSMVELRAGFPAAYERVSGSRWRRLRTELEARRPAPAPRPRPARTSRRANEPSARSNQP